jgi:tetratricopeptide (TPR) repeat protein
MRRLALLIALLVSTSVPVVADDPLAVLIEAGHWKRLRAIVEPRLAANPNDAEAAYLLSCVKQAFGDLEGALPLAEKAVYLDGRNSSYHYQLAVVVGQMGQKAGLLKQISLGRRFKKEAEEALALDPKNLDARLAMMEFYWQAPAIIGGDKKKALSTADEIQRINAARGYLAQAKLAGMAKEQDQAKLEGLYLRAIQADPRSYEAHMSLAFLYSSDAQKKYELAEKQAREAMKLDLGRAGAYVGLARLYALQERWQELDAILAQAEKNVPDNLNPTFQAGLIIVTRGKDLVRAERFFRKYLTQEPEGNAPLLSRAHWRLGQALEKEGRKPEAIVEIETALRLEPSFESAKKDLKRLK